MTQQIIESPFLFYHSSILPRLHMLLISVHRPSQEYHSLLQNLCHLLVGLVILVKNNFRMQPLLLTG